MCEKSEVPSVEEGHDVERVIVAQSDETASILKQVKRRNERGFNCTREEGVGSEDQSSGSYESRDAAKVGEITTLERQVQQRQRVRSGLHPRSWSTGLQAKNGAH